MVEGGARIINSFLQATLSAQPIDALIVTVAPTLVGAEGVTYGSAIPSGVSISFTTLLLSLALNQLLLQIPHLQHLDTQAVGSDAVLILKSVKV